MVVGNDSEVDILGVGTYKLRLLRGNILLFDDALYTHGVRVRCLFLVYLMKSGFFFNCHIDGLDIFSNDNAFGHATLKNNFLILGLDDCYNNLSYPFVSYFDFNSKYVRWHMKVVHIG